MKTVSSSRFFIFPICIVLVTVCLGAGVSATSISETVTPVETIALSGQAVPDVNGRTFEDFFRKAVLNNRGEAAFIARLECCGPRDGAFTTAGGSLYTLAILETPTFLDSDNTFFELDHVQIDDLGRAFLRGDVSGLPREFDTIAVGQQAGELVPIAASGMIVDPSQPDVTYRGFDFSHLGSGGRLAGRASTSSNGNSDLLFVSDGGPVTPLFRAGDQPDFIPASDSILMFERPVINAFGAITTRVATVNPNNLDDFPNQHVIRIDATGSVERIATESHGPNPPDPNIGSLFDLSFPVINDQGDIAFGAVVDSVGESLFLSRPGETPGIVVKEGDEPPTLPGGRFHHFFMNPHSEMPLGITGDGSLVFTAEVSGPELGTQVGESLWIASQEGLQPIAVEGRPAPGVDAVFASMGSTTGDFVSGISVNERNQVVFIAQYQQASLQRQTGLFATDSHGVLHKVAAPGDLLQVGPGDVREVQSVHFRSDIGQGPLGSGLNDLGQILFTARFTDGTGGVFLSNVVAVPEPSAIALGALGLLSVFLTAKGNGRKRP